MKKLVSYLAALALSVLMVPFAYSAGAAGTVTGAGSGAVAGGYVGGGRQSAALTVASTRTAATNVTGAGATAIVGVTPFGWAAGTFGSSRSVSDVTTVSGGFQLSTLNAGGAFLAGSGGAAGGASGAIATAP